MEKRTELKFTPTLEVFFEAVVSNPTTGYAETLVRNTARDLQNAIDVWLKDGKYELKSAHKVERRIPKLQL